VPEAAADALGLVRARADLGDLPGAAEACARALEAWPCDPALHYYDGLIAAAAGRTAEAGQAFRRAISLHGDFAMAHYQLGLLLLAAGQGRAGRRAIAAAARIAATLPAGTALEEGDGMSAGTLRASARLQLAPAAGARA
jgi:chemotaxis protein methyltransferase CheR